MRLITAFMARDHARLDGLLAHAKGGKGGISVGPFDCFREGLLRHIGLEEKILLPAVFGLPGAPLELAGRLRLEHGALTNLLVPRPTRAIAAALESILEPHNRREEEPGGFYEACDRLLAYRAEAVVHRMRTAPELPLRPYSNRPQALEAAKRALIRAGFDWERCIRIRP